MARDRSRERSPRDRRVGKDSRREADRDRDRERERERDRTRPSRNRSRDRGHNDREHGDRRDVRERDRHRDKTLEDDRSGKKGERSRDVEDGEVPGKAAKQLRKKEKEPEDGIPAAPLNLDADISPEEMQMMQSMGIPFGFNTTQGQHVEDDASNTGGVKLKQTRRARQYMNRKGGFNRALPSERSGATALRD